MIHIIFISQQREKKANCLNKSNRISIRSIPNDDLHSVNIISNERGIYIYIYIYINMITNNKTNLKLWDENILILCDVFESVLHLTLWLHL